MLEPNKFLVAAARLFIPARFRSFLDFGWRRRNHELLAGTSAVCFIVVFILGAGGVGYIGRVFFRWKHAVHDWQSVLGLLSATAAIVSTWLLERGRSKQTRDAMRHALGAELRMFAQRAFEAHKELLEILSPKGMLKIAQKITPKNSAVSYHVIKDIVRLGTPVMYQNSGKSVGDLGMTAACVVLFYGNVEEVRLGVIRFSEYPSDEPSAPFEAIWALAGVLSNVCENAAEALPAFAGSPKEQLIEGDAKFRSALEALVINWRAVKDSLPGKSDPIDPVAQV